MEKVAIGFVNSVMGPLFKVLVVDKLIMLKSVSHDCKSMRLDLTMLAAAMDDHLVRTHYHSCSTALATAYGDEMRDLMHDMEDCIERFLHRVTPAADGACRLAHLLRTARTHCRFASEIKALKKRLDDSRQRWSSIFARTTCSSTSTHHDGGGGGGGGGRRDDPIKTARCPGSPQAQVGNLLTMLEETPAEPRVMAIVGFGGSGKTTLARAVYQYDYDHPDILRRPFDCRAWVDQAKEKNALQILLSLLHQFVGRQGLASDLHGQLATLLKNYLRDKRYLIVIDDIGKGQWNTVKSIFFEDNDTNKNGSRIIVTTDLRSEANICCSNGNGFIYQMQNLKMQDCIRLALGVDPSEELIFHSVQLLKKCDGHPLSLVSVANHLAGQNEPTGQYCRRMCTHLGSLIQNNGDFASLKEFLMDNYSSLDSHTVRTCMLYLGIFPNNVPLERKVITRRWLAEGYARSEYVDSDQSVAEANFKTLVDRDILHPVVNTGKNGDVKACRTRGIVHEFVLHESIKEKFIMSLYDRRRRVRHLSVDHRRRKIGANCTTTLAMDVSSVRSLTVYGTVHDAMAELRRYKILRVLDLEECNDVRNDHLKHISKLWNLRYLSLGAEITIIPKSVARLKLLETLCLKKTKVEQLPVQVIGLPRLVHLIGKFRIQAQGCGRAELIKILEKSNLETLAGFVADQSQGFLKIFAHIKKLRKAKIWFQSAEDGSNDMADELSEAIQKYIGGPLDMGNQRSLSINLKGSSCHFLNSLKAPCYLTSLKLHGNVYTISHQFVSLFTDQLVELCLSSSFVTRHLLSNLSNLRCLLYLKLIADIIEEFAIPQGAFPSLRRLCFKVKTVPGHFPTVDAGALQKLVSLQLLCKDLNGLAGIEIGHLLSLREITLDSMVVEDAKQCWERQARQHPNKPRILYEPEAV